MASVNRRQPRAGSHSHPKHVSDNRWVACSNNAYLNTRPEAYPPAWGYSTHRGQGRWAGSIRIGAASAEIEVWRVRISQHHPGRADPRRSSRVRFTTSGTLFRRRNDLDSSISIQGFEKEPGTGWGLGLALVRACAEAHGGEAVIGESRRRKTRRSERSSPTGRVARVPIAT